MGHLKRGRRGEGTSHSCIADNYQTFQEFELINVHLKTNKQHA